jgi:alpha-L-fucosidase 2
MTSALSFRKRFTSNQPADSWDTGLLIGNGIMGASVYGQPVNETVVLNYAGLFSPLHAPLDPIDMAPRLTEIRSLIDAGRYSEASDILSDLKVEAGWGDDPRWTDPIGPVCDLRVQMEAASESVENYRRGVDMETGVAWVEWDTEQGPVRREAFVSRADNVLVLRIRREASFAAGIRFEQRPFLAPDAAGNITDYWVKLFDPEKMVADIEAKADGNELHYSHRFQTQWPGATKGVEAAGRIIAPGASIETAGERVNVSGASDILVLVRVRPVEQTPADASLLDGLGEIDPDFDALLARHATEHGALFNRVSLSLGASEADHAQPTETLIAESTPDAPSIALIEKQFYAARYNILCSTGMLPPPLQGIWAGTWSPAWSGDFTQNGNVQCAIAALLSGDTPELLEVYLRYLESQMDDYRTNARRMYNARGIHIPSRTSSHGLENHFSNEHTMPYWTAGAGWAAHFFYDYYLHTGDLEFLRNRAYPFMREAALFYEDYLYQDPDGRLVVNPSYSPENRPGNSDAQTCINATMDIAVARELLASLVAACEVLDIDPDGVSRWRDMLATLPEYMIDEDGAVKEWLTPKLEENHEHRHCSHLYALYDGLPPEIASDGPLRRAFLRATERRMEIRKRHEGGDMSFGLVQLGQAVSSLRNGESSGEILNWLSINYWFPNLATTHNPKSVFNMDLSGGFPALIHKMLAFCDEPGVIDLLPACPNAWSEGTVSGIRCRGGVRVTELDWNNGHVHVTLRSPTDQTITLRLPGNIKNTRSPCLQVSLKANLEFTTHIEYA